MSIRKYSRTSSLLALLVGGLVLSACGGPTAATPVPTTAGTTATNTVAVADQATPEPTTGSESTATTTSGGAQGKLVLYTTRTESLIKPVVDAYQKKNPGVEVVLLTGSSGELSAKLLEEKDNPQADVFINTDTIAMSSLASQGVFEPNPSTAVELVPEEYRAEDATWVALTLRARVIMYNTDLVKPEEAPKSMFDLTDPKWKGQVGSADSTNGSMQAQVVAMSALVGPERTGEFIAGLVANETRFFGGHTDVRKAVGAGELKLGLVNHYYYQLSKAEGAPVGVVYPDQGEGEMGVLVNSTNAGLVKGGPNLPAAHSFVEYLLTMEGQKVFADLNYEYPVREGVELAEGVQALDEYRLAEINLKTLFDELEAGKALMESAGLP
ncbi:MAG: extracellular solute-binding protein [Chloroflexota bacterium]|nr:extracellular solute-binding protein [Chloroflexota bacterium]MDQ5865222.1 extracellular solute-binding protein [Chloroflexota bacterium]